ncbi:PrpR N-terminal domain-containing protein [Vagococcus sp.]|uniref:PrpR N-terminal domain-containing protein n=1 Tax=Vagococcus sp. TaxID=1933889 RepID=UPI003F9811FD
MTKKKKILGIAPYEELKNSMEVVGQEISDIQTDIYTADLDEGRQMALKHYHDDYDAIISRGGTADLIRQSVSIPVIDVSISIYDILGAIRLADNYTNNYAIVGYSSITEPAHLLCDILGYNIKIITLNKKSDASHILDNLNQENFEMILCDVITNRLALSKSLNTILITSGYESVKKAYNEALTIIRFLKKEKHQKLMLEASLQLQEQDTIIFDTKFNPYFSTLSESLEISLLHFLTTRPHLDNNEQYYYNKSEKIYHLLINHLIIDETLYFSCKVKSMTPPIINNRFGITYQKRTEVVDLLRTQLLFSKFIQDKTKIELKKAASFYNALIIIGEVGTEKSNIAYQSFLNQKSHRNHLITIDVKLVNDKLWKFLLNSNNSPLLDENNTILFKNMEQLSAKDTDTLISIIKNTKLLQRNHLLFTYNSNNEKDNTVYNTLHMNLNCGRLYIPSLKERKNELNAMTTLLLNKINIECNCEIIGFDPKALEAFLDYDWPGNFKQIQAGLKELVINAKTHYISEHQVTQLIKKEQLVHNFSNYYLSSFSLPDTVEQPTLFDYSKHIILSILEQNEGNQTKTARQLGISRTTLWRYLKNN